MLFGPWIIPASAFQGSVQCRSSLTFRSLYLSTGLSPILNGKLITPRILPIHASYHKHGTQIICLDMSSNDVSSGDSAEDILQSTPSVIELPTT